MPQLIDESQNVAVARLERRVLAVCDTAGTFIEYWGFKSVHGRVWTLLALHTEPLTQREIARLLGVSPALVSGAMSDLAERGLVAATHEHRLAPYRAVVEVWPVISDVLREREWMMLESARNALEAAIEEAESLQDQGIVAPYDPNRLRFLLQMTEMGQGFLRLLIGLRLPSTSDEFGGWLQRAGGWMKSFRSATKRAADILNA